MKEKQLSLWIVGLLLLGTVQFRGQAAWPSGNREALVAQVCGWHVEVLRFNTDRPVTSVRLVIDGNVVGSEGYHSTANGFNLAVVEPVGTNEIHVYYDVSSRGMGGFMKGSRREIREANVMVDRYYGPGTNITIPDWTVVYSQKQHYVAGSTNPPALYEMKVEIKGGRTKRIEPMTSSASLSVLQPDISGALLVTAHPHRSTPSNSVPPAPLAKATTVRITLSGEDRSRLNLSVLPSA